MSSPLIGLSVDWVDDPRGHAFGLHQLRAAYVDAVEAAGGVAVLLPSTERAIESLLPKLDGVVLTGGAFDISPALFGEPPSPKLGPLKPERTSFELALFNEAYRQGRPVLGICGGMQLINVACGGTLYQHLPDELPGALEHEQATDRRLPAHLVEVTNDTRLQRLVGPGALPVNTSHHQGVKRLGVGLRASARSTDGLIEAFEEDGPRFVVGVEWHPELLLESEPRHRRLFEGLLSAAAR